MNSQIKLATIVFLIGTATFSDSTSDIQNQQTWIEKSNQIFVEYNLDVATISPEMAANFGAWEFSKQTTDLTTDMETRWLDFFDRWSQKLKKMKSSTSDSNLKEDINILINYIDSSRAYTQTNQKVGKITIEFGPEQIFGNIIVLLYEGAPNSQKLDAVERFHRYVNGHNNTLPILEAQKNRIRYLMSLDEPKKKFFPTKRSMHKLIDSSTTILNLLETYFTNASIDGWRQDFAIFSNQVEQFNEFIKSTLMPYCRDGKKIPQGLYINNLRVSGINATPQELIDLAEQDYANLYTEFERLLKSVALRHHLDDASPQTVMRFLRSDKITNENELINLYKKVNSDLIDIISKHNLITLPEDPLIMKVISSELSQLASIPHIQLPPLIENQGEMPVFQMPSMESGDTIDDFSYTAAAYSLLAHEGRPGHDLQIRFALDKEKVSKIRVSYAFNSVNVEGWGMYAETIVYPYFTDEQKVAGLQLRLLRILRMMLEPKLVLNQINEVEIANKIETELGYTKYWANREAKRYASWTGQAPSYHYGFRKLVSMKERVKKSLGSSFTEKCFHDAFLEYGFLPIDMIGDRLVRELNCNKTP